MVDQYDRGLIKLPKESDEILKEKNALAREFLEHKQKGVEVNIELSENTVVLEVLAKAVEKIKYKTQQKIAKNLFSEILPILKEIKREKNLEKISILVELAIMRLKVFIPPPDNSFSLLEKLTPMEMSIAAMIKDGFKSKDIANLQFVSLDTVKTHRSNIRKKLNLKNKRINLASYLKGIFN